MSASLEQLHAAFLRWLAPQTGEGRPGPSAVQTPTTQAPEKNSLPEPAAASPATAATTPSSVPPVPTAPCQLVDPKAKGYHLDASVKPDQVVTAAHLLDEHGFAIDTVTGVDWMAAGEMEVVYDFFHPTAGLHAVVRTRVPRANPELPTISSVFPGANWHERETHEFFGIRFLGHPNLTPLLLPEDATYHPLRKDFSSAA